MGSPARRVAAVAFALGVSLAGPAHADDLPTLSPGLPRVVWFGAGPRGDAATASRTVDEGGALAFEPLRLTLLGAHPWMPTNQCGDQYVDARAGGSPLLQMGTFGANLLGGSSSWSPRLSVFGFSRQRCAIDGAAGAGFTFTQPLTPKVLFALSAGAIIVPGAPPGMQRTSRDARMDLVFPRGDGRSFNVGFGTRGATFGGRF
jgi:hypothetical protein